MSQSNSAFHHHRHLSLLYSELVNNMSFQLPNLHDNNAPHPIRLGGGTNNRRRDDGPIPTIDTNNLPILINNNVFDLSGRSLEEENDDDIGRQRHHGGCGGGGGGDNMREIDDANILLRLDKLKNDRPPPKYTTTSSSTTYDDDDEIIRIDKFLIKDVVFTCTSADALIKALTYIKDANTTTTNTNTTTTYNKLEEEGRRCCYYYKFSELVLDNVRQNFEFYLVLKHILELEIFSTIKFDQLNYEWTYDDDGRIRAQNIIARQQQQQMRNNNRHHNNQHTTRLLYEDVTRRLAAGVGVGGDNNDDVEIHSLGSEHSSMPGLISRNGIDPDSEDDSSATDMNDFFIRNDDQNIMDVEEEDENEDENNNQVQIDLGDVVVAGGGEGNGDDDGENMENNDDDDDDESSSNPSMPELVERGGAHDYFVDDSEDDDDDTSMDSIPELIKPRTFRGETANILKDYSRGGGMTTTPSAQLPMDTTTTLSTSAFNGGSLQSLILHRVQLDEDGWMALGQCLISSNQGCQLQELQLMNVRFGRGQALDDIDMSFSNFLVGLTENSSLQKFTLQMVRDLSDSQLARLIQALPKTTLQELFLNETPWHEETITAITDELLTNPDCNLRKLSLASPLPSRRIWFELFFPSSSTSQLTLPLMRSLLEGLTKNTTLQRLCLKSCGLDNENFNLLMTTLSKASKKINLQELDLSGNWISSFDITQPPTPPQRNPEAAALFETFVGGGLGGIGDGHNDVDEESSNFDEDDDDSEYVDDESDEEDGESGSEEGEDPTTSNNENKKKNAIVVGTNSRLRKLNMAENPIFSHRLSIWLRYSRTQEENEAETAHRSIEQQVYICELLKAFRGLGKLDGIEEMPRLYTSEIENILDMNDSGLRLLQHSQQLNNNDADDTLNDDNNGSGADGAAGVDIHNIIPPLSLWSMVLERVASEEALAKYHEYNTSSSSNNNNGDGNNAENNENAAGSTNESRAATAKRRQANAIYHLLQGPVFAARNSMY